MKRVFQIGSMFDLAAVFAAACSKQSANPASPSGAEQAGGNATPAGGLKASAPTAQSPTNGVKPTGTLVLVAGRASMLYVTEGFPLSYEFEILTTSGARVWGEVVGGGSGSTISVTPTASLNADQPYNWRVRGYPKGREAPGRPTRRSSGTSRAPSSTNGRSGIRSTTPTTASPRGGLPARTPGFRVSVSGWIRASVTCLTSCPMAAASRKANFPRSSATHPTTPNTPRQRCCR